MPPISPRIDALANQTSVDVSDGNVETNVGSENEENHSDNDDSQYKVCITMYN